MRKQIQISELMSLVKVAWADLSDWTVGFVKTVKTPRSGNENEFDLVLCGSGVLVTANDRHAILTADHVLEALPNTGFIGLVLLSRLGLFEHQFKLNMNCVQKLTVARGTDEASGPDLAMLILSRSEVGRLQSKKLFHNLDIRRTAMLGKPGANQVGAWVMCGLVDEMTENITPHAGIILTKAFKGICGPVIVNRPRHDGKFDYLSAEVNCGKIYQLPESFGGCSGSGLWRLALGETNGVITIEGIHLSGIAFYESAQRGNRRFIEYHGCRSIYETVFDRLANS